jgi:hypothetical protein
MRVGISGAAIATVISQTVSMSSSCPFSSAAKASSAQSPACQPPLFDYLLIVSTASPRSAAGPDDVATAMLNVQSGGTATRCGGDDHHEQGLHDLPPYRHGHRSGLPAGRRYNYGAGKKARVKEAFGFALMVGTVICLITGSLVFCTGRRSSAGSETIRTSSRSPAGRSSIRAISSRSSPTPTM